MEFRPRAAISSIGVTTDTGETAQIQTRLQKTVRLFRHGALFVVATIVATSALMAGVFRVFAAEYRTPQSATVFGVQIRDLTTTELQAKLTSIQEQTVPVVLADSSTATLRLADMGIQFDSEETAIRASDADSEVWNGDVLMPRVWVNQANFQAFVVKALVGAKEPVAAELVRDGSKIVVKPSVDGWGVGSDSLLTQVSRTLSSGSPLRLSGERIVPAVTTTDAERVRGAAQAFADSQISVVIEDAIQVIPSVDVMYVSRDQESSSIEYGYDAQLLRERLQTIADAYTSKPWNELFTISNGQKAILRAGKDGFLVGGVDEALQELIDSGLGVANRTVNLQKAAVSYNSLNWSQSNTWIDVNLTTHRMTLWEAGEEQAVFPISGGKASTPTPTGDYKITSKVRKMTMSGPGYSTPNIEYVSWFKFNYAIHSAYWHDDFGVANVSHGCVNARTDDAKYVYEWAPTGTKVSVHY